MSWLFRCLPYALAIAISIAGAVDLYQKREEYKDKRLKQSVIALFIIISLLTMFGLYHDNDEKEKADNKSERNITELKGKLDVAAKAENTAIKDQKNNTDIFAKQFRALSGELFELKTQVRTAALLKKIASLQTELQNTQKAVAPAPKAKVLFTFIPFTNPPVREGHVDSVAAPVTDVTLPITADGSVHVEFSVLNVTDASALNVSLTLVICDECKFAKEPEGFTKLPGDNPNTHRWMPIPQLHVAEAWKSMNVDVIPPPAIAQFAIGIMYRCDTCVLDRSPLSGTVHVMRDFLKNIPR